MQSINEIYTTQPRPVRVAQFGEGNFLRAFVDWMIDIANEQGEFDGNVAIIKPIEYGNLNAFSSQGNVYTVQLRGIVDGKPQVQNRVVRSVGKAIDPFNGPDAFWALAEAPELRFVVSNTTEAGIEFRADDPRPEQGLSKTFPGKLTQFLLRRYKRFDGAPDKGLIMLPVELIDRNGDHLRDCVHEYCRAWALDDAFVRWLDEACVFTCTLVDRIVTGYPRDDAEAVWAALGYEDRLITTGEPFALWVIESSRDISHELPLDRAGLPVIFTRDLTPYKERKVRILNGGHTSSVLAAYLAGCKTVLDMMNDAQLCAYLERAMLDEMVPCVPLPAEEARAFALSVLERFRNPYVKHQLLSISLNSFSKWRARLLNSFRDNMARGNFPRRIAFSFAAMLAFYVGQARADGYYGNVNGEVYRILDDERVIEAVSAACKLTPERYAHEIMTREDFWGEDLTRYDGFEACVAGDLDRILSRGVRAAIDALN